MLTVWHVVAWFTFVSILVASVATAALVWVAAQRPQYLNRWLRRRVRVPREAYQLNWEQFDKDNPIPGV